MTRRLLILVVVVPMLGCVRENPAFDPKGETTVANESGDGEPTGPDESDESPGDGDGDGDSSDSESSSETTDGECDCGPCQACNGVGECVIDVGAPCDGPAIHCADYLAGPGDTGICYRLVDFTLDARCSEQGVCEPAPVSECPPQKGEVHFACDLACVSNFEGCKPHKKASEVEMSAMCLVDGEQGPGCTNVCANGIQGVVQHHGCLEGECTPLGMAELCLGYLCDEQGIGCADSCETDAQCGEQFTCFETKCVPD